MSQLAAAGFSKEVQWIENADTTAVEQIKHELMDMKSEFSDIFKIAASGREKENGRSNVEEAKDKIERQSRLALEAMQQQIEQERAQLAVTSEEIGALFFAIVAMFCIITDTTNSGMNTFHPSTDGRSVRCSR